MKRRQPAEAPLATCTAPPALLVGRCVEVWADDGASHISAWRRSRDGRAAWQSAAGLTDRESWRVLPPAGVYSLAAQIAAGYRDIYVERFAAAGVAFDDIPALRTEADRLAQGRPA